MAANLTIALAGNPNVGKSTIFNCLTGARQHVGNWPGKTVEKKEGVTDIAGQNLVVVDLPGIYSLNAFSPEEVITRDFILNEKPDVVVAVADASNLERSLYLVVQLLELKVPLVLALNMGDIAQARGIAIDPASISAQLGNIPVVETVSKHGAGIDALKQTVHQLVATPQSTIPVPVDYGEPVEAEITALQTLIEADPTLDQRYDARWLAVKLLEAEEDILAYLEAAGQRRLLDAAREAMQRIKAASGDDSETLIADRRYRFIGQALNGAVTRPSSALETGSDRIDRIITHRVWGLPIFILLMWVVFQFTANVSAPLLDWVDGVVGGPVTRWATAIFGALGLGGSWVESLAVDGVFAGVGGVLVFVPVLFFLYLAIAILEDSGYMARAAFIMDDFMRTLGLHGKSFLPLLVGFGCTVPAIYATRTLENDEDRRLTAFLTTFISCGARLPVYVLFGAAFFGAKAGVFVFSMYLAGGAAAVATGFILKSTVFKNKSVPPFIMEMPAYRAPTLKGVLLYVWKHTSQFLRKATTVILAASVVLWFLTAVPAGATLEQSLFGIISKALAPVFAPAGFDSWEATGALVTGFVAKEVIVSTLGQVYLGGDDAPAAETPTLGEDLAEIARSLGEAVVLTVQETINIVPRTVNVIPGVSAPEADFFGAGEADAEDTTELEAALNRTFTPLSAVAFGVFVVLYVPCMAAVAAIRQEFGARWALYQVTYSLGVAWLVAVVVYQGGRLLGLG
ncbi:MAG: ferrous iron transport protein B [Anaerolineae bacterium]|nr:ferrous iron transport protein B [Anaerolineae bacterium]